MVGALALIALAFAALPARAFDERIIYDPYSGLSLGGYDPVAYFTDGKALRGTPEHEVVLGDTYWHFLNGANADIFKADPLAYIPGFGGYSIGSLVRGVAAPGSPTIFTIYRNRVYLFASETERQSFLASPDAQLEKAAAAWPKMLKLLAY